MTTRNFDAFATLNDGTPIKDEKEQISYKTLIVNSLGALFETDRNVASGELYKRGKLADKVASGGDIELSAEDMTTIKTHVAKMFPPRVISAIHDYVDKDYKATTSEN